ncbi:kinase-like domain-containing protein [Glomus cerebriforme]|uniref:Kinase-like domain-containing protein n=1 Tax=Glomus cerebriforme TaxID=658196 RepID=A0A397TSJ9_9GLOM|nr:kinase-like domain-containing protein [Glomus cerebriforme]
MTDINTLIDEAINHVNKTLYEVIVLYKDAQHNKNITKILLDRFFEANTIVNILRANEELFPSYYYTYLQRLIKVLLNMENYIKEITQYNTVIKFLKTKTIEKKFKDLCKDYDDNIKLLNFTLPIEFKFINPQDEDKILKEDIEELLKFQQVLAEIMNEKVTDTNDKMNSLIEDVIPMHSLATYASLHNLNINILNESPLPFEDYERIDDERIDNQPDNIRPRKYFHIKTRELFAFKIINIRDKLNQVPVFKKLKDCQNIIRFYGITRDENTLFVVIEWAENKNLREYISDRGQDIEIRLRLKIAYDIAKGLNFINSIKVHREICSKNVLITGNNVAKIIMISQLLYNCDHYDENKYKDYFVYSAPEMLLGEIMGERMKSNIRSEVYSFGILLWEIAECRIPYKQFDNMEIKKKVLNGYREKFTIDTAIPETYQTLVNNAVDQNSGRRPMFSKMLIDLHDIFKNYISEQLTNSSNIERSTPATLPLVQRMTNNTIATEDESAIIHDLDSFNYMSIERVIKEHNLNIMNKNILYKCFDAYANMGNPEAKYWKAYYITEGWSDLKCSTDEKNKIAAQLFKEIADRSDGFPDAQFRYSLMVMQGKGDSIHIAMRI